MSGTEILSSRPSVSPPASCLEWPGSDEEPGSLQARGSHHEGQEARRVGQTALLRVDGALPLNPECRSWITRTSSNSSKPSKIASALFSAVWCSKAHGPKHRGEHGRKTHLPGDGALLGGRTFRPDHRGKAAAKPGGPGPGLRRRAFHLRAL